MKGTFEVVAKNGHPFAVVVSTDDGLGFSVCNPVDRFNLGRGIEIAVGRAKRLNNGRIRRHGDIWGKLEYMVDKAQRKGRGGQAERLKDYVFPTMLRMDGKISINGVVGPAFGVGL